MSWGLTTWKDKRLSWSVVVWDPGRQASSPLLLTLEGATLSNPRALDLVVRQHSALCSVGIPTCGACSLVQRLSDRQLLLAWPLDQISIFRMQQVLLA